MSDRLDSSSVFKVCSATSCIGGMNDRESGAGLCSTAAASAPARRKRKKKGHALVSAGAGVDEEILDPDEDDTDDEATTVGISLVAATAPYRPPEPPVSSGAAVVIGLASFCTFAMGGVVFGISSLYPVLYRQGFWRELCGSGAAAAAAVRVRVLSQGPPECADLETKCCDAQLVRFSLVASVAFFCTDVAAAPWGVLADSYGARTCLAAAVSMSCAGLLLLGCGSALDSDVLTTSALLVLGLAGPGVFNGGYLGGLQLIPEEQAKTRATLASCLAAVFDGSSLVFVLLRALAVALGTLVAPTAVWAALCGCVGAAFWARLGGAHAQPAAPAAPSQPGEMAAASSSEIEMRELGAFSSPGGAVGGGGGGGGGEGGGEGEGGSGAGGPPRTLRATLLCVGNAQLVCFMASYNLISSYYLETQIDYFETHFGAATAASLSALFNLAFPIGGLLAAAPASFLLQRHGTRPVVYWGVTASLATLFTTLSLLPSYLPQLLGALLFGPTRCLQWACYFQFLADERRYPPHLTGRALGYNNSLVALVGDLVPYVLTSLTATDGWGGDLDGRYLRIKAGGLACLALVVGWAAAHAARGGHAAGATRPVAPAAEK